MEEAVPKAETKGKAEESKDSQTLSPQSSNIPSKADIKLVKQIQIENKPRHIGGKSVGAINLLKMVCAAFDKLELTYGSFNCSGVVKHDLKH